MTVRYLSSLSQLPEARGIKKQSESEIENFHADQLLFETDLFWNNILKKMNGD